MKMINMIGLQDKSVELAVKAIDSLIDDCSDLIATLRTRGFDATHTDSIAMHREALRAARADFVGFFGIEFDDEECV